jgi:hypothetical protein
MLEDLSEAQRDAFFDVMRTTLSARGFGQARDIMRLNELLGEDRQPTNRGAGRSTATTSPSTAW